MALGLASLILRETPKREVRFDIAGASTLALAMAALMLALGRLRELGPASPTVWGATILGGAGLAAFVAVERRSSRPLLPLEFFRRRNFTAPITANAFMGAAYMGAFVVAPLVLLELFDFSITAASLVMLLRTSTLTVASLGGGYLGGRIGERAAATGGAVVMTAALAVIAWGAAAGALVPLGAGLVLQGLGHGLALPSLSSAVASAVPIEDVGVATAASRLTTQVGTAFGITLLTLVYGGVNTGGAFARAFLVGVVLSVLSTLAALAMDRSPHQGK